MSAHITATELRDRVSSGTPPRLLDVRSPAEFETAHIAGAFNVPLDVVFVCRSGQRAAQADEVLRAAAIGGGLTFAAASNTCAMGTALSKLPYNRTADYDPAALVSRLG